MDNLEISLEILKITVSSKDLENLSLEEKQQKTIETLEKIHEKVVELNNQNLAVDRASTFSPELFASSPQSMRSLIHKPEVTAAPDVAFVPSTMSRPKEIILDGTVYEKIKLSLEEVSTGSLFKLKSNSSYKIKDSTWSIQFSSELKSEPSSENYLGTFSSKSAIDMIRRLDLSDTGKFFKIEGINQTLQARVCKRVPVQGVPPVRCDGQVHPGVCPVANPNKCM